jgi:hypothetical protein
MIVCSEYADDTTCFLKNAESAQLLFQKLEVFKQCSGLEVNRCKTEGLWLGGNIKTIPIQLYSIYVGLKN